ncbi:MAG: hypothetical protein ACRDSH_07305 [Pseudonocardiaceae bacterium]
MDGWVEDTAKNGNCAEVFARFTNGAPHSRSACPKGTIHKFSWKEPASDADVFLRNVG